MLIWFWTGMLLFSTRILIFCAIVLVGSLSSFLYACPREDFFLPFSYSLMFITTVVLPLSAGSTMMFVSLFRSWGANHSCLVIWFDGKGLTLEKILVPYLLILMGVGRWLTLFG